MPWTEIAAAPYLSPDGLARSVRLSVRDAGAPAPPAVWASFDTLPETTPAGGAVALASGGTAAVEGAAVASVPGASGTGARFTGLARLALPSPISTPAYTISFWIRRDETAAPQVVKCIVSSSHPTEAHHVLTQGWGLTTYAEGAGGFTPAVYTVPADSAYHHVVLTVVGTTGRWFADGVDLGTFANAVNAQLRPVTHVGNNGQVTNPNAAGRLDEVRIYPRALTAAEVAVLYQYPPGGPAAVQARVVADAGFTHRVGQPDAHVLADHAPTIVECSLLGLAPDALTGRADADIRLDVLGSAGRLLYRGHVRAEGTQTPFGAGAPPVRLFSYDGVEGLTDVPYAAGPQQALSGTLSIAETAAELLAPVGHGLPVVVLLGWEHAGQRTDVARARSIRADVRRWGVAASGTPSYRDALRSLLVALNAQLVLHVTPATAPGGGGAVWLLVQRSLRTAALRDAAAGGPGAAAAAWVTGARGAWSTQDVSVAALGLTSANAVAVVIGPSTPKLWAGVTGVVSRHPSAQGAITDEEFHDVEAVTYRPLWWQGIKLATGASVPAQVLATVQDGVTVRGASLDFSTSIPDAVVQRTERSFPAGTGLSVRVRKWTRNLQRTGPKTSLRFAMVVARSEGYSPLYLQAGQTPDGLPSWTSYVSYISTDVETPNSTMTGFAECSVAAPALLRAAQVDVYIVAHQGAEQSAVAVSASVQTQRSSSEVLGVEAAWPVITAMGSGTAQAGGRGPLVDIVPVGDSTAVTRGTAALEVQTSGGGWASAASSWKARPAGPAGMGFSVARVVDVAEQSAPPLAGVGRRGAARLARRDSRGLGARVGRMARLGRRAASARVRRNRSCARNGARRGISAGIGERHSGGSQLVPLQPRGLSRAGGAADHPRRTYGRRVTSLFHCPPRPICSRAGSRRARMRGCTFGSWRSPLRQLRARRRSGRASSCPRRVAREQGRGPVEAFQGGPRQCDGVRDGVQNKAAQMQRKRRVWAAFLWSVQRVAGAGTIGWTGSMAGC